MNLDDKITHARLALHRLQDEFRRPAVLWGSGKDSMVLLHLARSVRHDWPVIFFREREQPRRNRFADQLIADWNLTVYSWPPAATVLGDFNGKVNLFHRYAMGQTTVDMPVLIEEFDDVFEGVCGLDVVRQPKGTMECPWDVLLHGHKSVDDHECSGKVPLLLDLRRPVAGPAIAFPLRTWTDTDVWDYLDRHAVPFQEDRYVDRKEVTRHGNPDYLIGCKRCVDPDAPAVVWCPKLNCETNNVSHHLTRQDLNQPYIAKGT